MSNTDTPGSRTLSRDVVAHRATVADAAGISAVWEQIVAERRYSAVADPWSASEEAAHIEGLSSRESVFVASTDGRIVGFQSLDRWAGNLLFVDHVGQLGTLSSGGVAGDAESDRCSRRQHSHSRASTDI